MTCDNEECKLWRKHRDELIDELGDEITELRAEVEGMRKRLVFTNKVLSEVCEQRDALLARLEGR